MEINGADSVIYAINAQGGVYMFGRMIPIWAVVLVEFVFAYSLECLAGSPLSFKMAISMFDPKKVHPMIFETVIISCTVLIMCHAMSFIAAFLYYPYYNGFNIFTRDMKVYHCGASSKDACKRITTITRIMDSDDYKVTIKTMLGNPSIVLR